MVDGAFGCGAYAGTLGGFTPTLGSAAGTLGGATATLGRGPAIGGDGIAVLVLMMAVGAGLLGAKMVQRLSIASSCACVLSGERSDLIALVRARRQWMMRSSGDSSGQANVGCWNTTVSQTTVCCVELLTTL